MIPLMVAVSDRVSRKPTLMDSSLVIAHVAYPAMNYMHPGIVGVPLMDPQLRRPYRVLTRRGDVLSHSAKQLLDLIVNNLPDHVTVAKRAQ